MISRCLKDQSGFGVVLIREGAETHTTQEAIQPRLFGIGTYATIVDFSELAGGTLGVITAGGVSNPSTSKPDSWFIDGLMGPRAWERPRAPSHASAASVRAMAASGSSAHSKNPKNPT